MSDPRPKPRAGVPQEGAYPPMMPGVTGSLEDAYYGYPGYPGYDQKTGKAGLEEAMDLLYKGKWIILLTFVAITAAVAVYNYQLVPQYQSASIVMVNPSSAAGVQDVFSGEDNPMSFFTSSRNQRSLDNELFVLRNSLVIAERVATRLVDLGEVPGTGAPITALGSGEEPNVKDVASRLRISVGQERGVDAIRVTATSSVPSEASLVANLYADEYVQYTQEASRSRLSASRTFLEEQEANRLAELQDIESRVTAYMTQEGAVSLDAEGQELVSRVSTLEAQRDQLRIDLQMQEASLQLREQELREIQPQLAQQLASNVSSELQSAQTRIAELELTRQEIYLRNPDLRNAPSGSETLREINRQITQLQEKVSQLSRQYVDDAMAAGGVEGSAIGYVAGLQREIATQRIAISGQNAQLELINQRIGEYDQQMRALPAQTVQLANLQRSRQYAESMYSGVVEKLQQVRIAEESEVGYARVIRQAGTPRDPVSPKKERNIMLGALLGLFLGLALAAVRKVMDNRVYTPDDLRVHGGESVIGVIPEMSRLIKEDFEGAETVALDGRDISTSLVTLLNPMSPTSEAYRHLRTNVQFSRPDTMIETILVSSAGPGEGKTVTASNLAVILAQAGRRTVIVDTDLRKPKLHQQLGVPREPGLIQMIFDEENQDAHIMETGVDDLYVIPAGRSVPNPSEILGSKRMREVIAYLKERFDVVILDTPPVLVATDAVLLSTQCDATIVVAAAGGTNKHELEHCLNALGSVGAHVIGTVLNGFEASMAYGYGYGSRYSYYSKYGYGYGYGYGYADSESKRFGRRGKKKRASKKSRA